jgi:solute carrier family 45 protein 1/2/4
MVGGAFIPSAHVDDYELDELTTGSHPDAHAVQWVGTPSVKGPKWARTPLLTVGMMGIQCVWSIENAYGMCAKPFLLSISVINCRALHVRYCELPSPR